MIYHTEEKNCRNCGAPLNERGDCEYCGTRRQRQQGSQIEITADGIRLSVWDSPVDLGGRKK